jgi:hypothetical protein
MIVWFNGLSQRQLIDIPKRGLEIGCNYIRRVRPVDFVVAYDGDVINNIEREPSVIYYTRPAQAVGDKWLRIGEDNVQGLNSGCLAVLLATKLSKNTIYIIGCDWGLNLNTVFDYGKGEQRKYNNQQKKFIRQLAKDHDIVVVNDQKVDVPVEIITSQQFINKYYPQGRTL